MTFLSYLYFPKVVDLRLDGLGFSVNKAGVRGSSTFRDILTSSPPCLLTLLSTRTSLGMSHSSASSLFSSGDRFREGEGEQEKSEDRNAGALSWSALRSLLHQLMCKCISRARDPSSSVCGLRGGYQGVPGASPSITRCVSS